MGVVKGLFKRRDTGKAPEKQNTGVLVNDGIEGVGVSQPISSHNDFCMI